MNTENYIHLHVGQLATYLPFLAQIGSFCFDVVFTLFIYIPQFPLVFLAPADACFGLFKKSTVLSQISIFKILPVFLL